MVLISIYREDVNTVGDPVSVAITAWNNEGDTVNSLAAPPELNNETYLTQRPLTSVFPNIHRRIRICPQNTQNDADKEFFALFRVILRILRATAFSPVQSVHQRHSHWRHSPILAHRLAAVKPA